MHTHTADGYTSFSFSSRDMHCNAARPLWNLSPHSTWKLPPRGDCATNCVCCWGVHCLVRATVVQRCTGMFTVCVCVASLVFGPAPFRRCNGRERRGCWRWAPRAAARHLGGSTLPPPRARLPSALCPGVLALRKRHCVYVADTRDGY
ncbi:hypothetical protein IscW_ISCW004409 [Ixodes scapularis]|uniref:Uncharacterized protein n=1 Tax=Ixodes scapularis TaxID=6945 RepID=B7PJ71_IXOSC|nr:hypothetical protein IscW_ISCW004409 [Ixodes scapularis]|eukprot:XP_002407249.1 hypothetical protein IscW_ISCW004409 [Ixodes scapularis]